MPSRGEALSPTQQVVSLNPIALNSPQIWKASGSLGTPGLQHLRDLGFRACRARKL